MAENCIYLQMVLKDKLKNEKSRRKWLTHAYRIGENWVHKPPLPLYSMAAHSSILVWRIPWTEEPDRLYNSWGRTELDITKQLTLSLS